MSRFRAAGIHLAISVVIFIALAGLIVFVWYPGILFETDGGWRGMRIIIGVDLVAGPLLTLVVFKAGKPGLKMDLSLIALLQALCLIAGTWVVWSERPLGIVYVDSRFQVMTRGDYLDVGYPIPELGRFEGNPRWLQVTVPDDVIAEADLRRKYTAAAANLALASEHYEVFDPHSRQFRDSARNINRIADHDGGGAALDAWIATYGGSLDDYNFYTYSTRYVYRYLGFRETTGEALGFLDVQPR